MCKKNKYICKYSNNRILEYYEKTLFDFTVLRGGILLHYKSCQYREHPHNDVQYPHGKHPGNGR